VIARLRPFVVVGLYLVVTVVALDALIANFSTAMPGALTIQPSDQIQPTEFDIFLWDLWWVRHAVFDLRISPLYTDYLVYPFTSPLAGHTLVLLWGFVSAPFQALFGLIPTFNGIILLNFVAAGSLTYAFARRRVRRASVAWLAGLIFAFTPAMIHRASLGHIDKLSIFWLPLVLLIWDKLAESRRWTWAVILGLCLYLAWLTDFQQAMWAMLLLVPYGLFWTQTHTDNTDGKNQSASTCVKLRPMSLGPLAAIALVTLILPSLIVPLPQLLEAGRLNYPAADLQHAAYFAFPLQNFFTPDDNGDFSIGLLLPLFTLASLPFLRRDGRRWLWLGIALLCFLLALGPYLDIGSTRIPLPYSLVHAALGNQYRTPMRFATPGVFALAMLVALTLNHFSARFNLDRFRLSSPALAALRRGFVVGLSLLFTLDYRLLQPFPITHMPDYQAYHTIAVEPGDFTVLEIPIGVRTGFAVVGRGEYLQYYQTIHRRPIPSGYLSRLPGEITDFFYFDPLVGAFALSQPLPPDTDARLDRLIRDWNIGYVILHRDMLEPGRVRSFGNLLDRQPALERIGEDGPLVVYRVTSP
jgi:hypothetical protein